jgi:hypothetical protein
MTSTEIIKGWATFIVIGAGFLVSNHYVNLNIPVQNDLRAIQGRRIDGLRLDKSGGEYAPEEKGSHLICVDLNGKRFGWPWPNAPFGSTCTRAD